MKLKCDSHYISGSYYRESLPIDSSMEEFDSYTNGIRSALQKLVMDNPQWSEVRYSPQYQEVRYKRPCTPDEIKKAERLEEDRKRAERLEYERLKLKFEGSSDDDVFIQAVKQAVKDLERKTNGQATS